MHALPPNADGYGDEKLSNGVHPDSSIEHAEVDVHEVGKSLSPMHLKQDISIKDTAKPIDANKDVTSLSNTKSHNYKNGDISHLSLNLEDNIVSNINKDETDIVPDVENESYCALSYSGNNTNVLNQTGNASVIEDLSDCDNESLENFVMDNDGRISGTEEQITTTKDVQSSQDSTGYDKCKEDISSTIDLEQKVLKMDSTRENDIRKNPEESPDMTQSNMDAIVETTIIDDNFGDFDTAFAPSNDENEGENIIPSNNAFGEDICNDNCKERRSEDPVFDESDDDFGDFGEIVTSQVQQVLPCSEENSGSEQVSPNTLSSTNSMLITVRHM